jgi:nucleoside-diphosphate-sugar epimerase
MFEAFRNRIDHFLHCGSIWSYGTPERVPYEECHPRRPFTDYGQRKAEIERFLFEKFMREGFPATVIHPGHICGRKWMPVDPQGARDNVEVYRRLATGQEVLLPDGKGTLHHVHGDDVAQLFELAIHQRQRALGEAFSAVAPYAISLVGCCCAVAGMFGRQSNIRFVSLDEIDRSMTREAADCIRDHVSHSPCCSIAKAQRLLGYQPRYTSEQIYAECLEYLLESGQLKI